MTACPCNDGTDDRCCFRSTPSDVALDAGVAEAELAKEFNNLRGRILGLIESWGLPESQERGAKSTFKSLTYDAQARLGELL